MSCFDTNIPKIYSKFSHLKSLNHVLNLVWLLTSMINRLSTVLLLSFARTAHTAVGFVWTGNNEEVKPHINKDVVCTVMYIITFHHWCNVAHIDLQRLKKNNNNNKWNYYYYEDCCCCFYHTWISHIAHIYQWLTRDALSVATSP